MTVARTCVQDRLNQSVGQALHLILCKTSGAWGRRSEVQARLDADFVRQVRACDFTACSDSELRNAIQTLRLGNRDWGIGNRAWKLRRKTPYSLFPSPQSLSMVFAIVSESIRRRLGISPSDEQLAAGLLLYRGAIVEMDAGEGKTVAAAFPAVIHWLLGKKVHIITANDYLAARDADWLEPVYELLGLDVGAILGYMGDDERRYSYRQDVIYGTLREFGFDFLRDNLKLPPDAPVQGPLHVAIIDEADHTLIDQARTPLIISGGPTGSSRAFHKTRRAIAEIVSLQAEKVRELEQLLDRLPDNSHQQRQVLAKIYMADPDNRVLRKRFSDSPRSYKRVLSMIEDGDLAALFERLDAELFYRIDSRVRSVTLTDRGQQALEEWLGPAFDTTRLEGELASLDDRDDLTLEGRRMLGARLARQIARQRRQMNLAYQMLRAYVLLNKDVDYLVADDTVVLIDELTGRTLPDNVYQQGLHAAIQAKEGVTVRPDLETLAQISVQGLVNQFAHVSGMTGTALDSRDEFEREYGLRVVRITPNRASRRADFGARLYLDRREKLAALVEEVRFCQRAGRPVLIGTLTVKQSEEISRLLSQAGVRHSLLNAVSSASEAEVVRRAGSFGAVTVSTNMAGRGTDIVLEPDLERRILRGYADLICQLLNEGAGQVDVACATVEEARLLEGALLVHMDDSVKPRTLVRGVAGPPRTKVRGLIEVSISSFLIARAGGASGGPSLVVSSRASSVTDRSARLEFGLGLYVIGTEMNRSARVDRQLRGRSGRQGAFGASRFFLSLEDDSLALHGADAGNWRRERHTDMAGRVYFEGPRVEHCLRDIQERAEQDDSAIRSLVREYTRVLEAQTFVYYQGRQQVIQSPSFHDTCKRLTGYWAERFIQRHFPGNPYQDYEFRFERMAEELWIDYGIDVYPLEGLWPDEIAEGAGALLWAALEGAREQCEDIDYARLEKLLFLQTADNLWRSHVEEMQELLLSSSLVSAGHRAGIADYAIKGFERYRRYKEEVIDDFLRRLVKIQPDRTPQSRPAEPEPVKDLAEILV